MDRVLMDVSRHHVGVEGPPGCVTPILSRHSEVPSRAARSFETTDSRLELNILQGTSERVEQNLFLGRLLWEVPFRRGPTSVVVAVEVDVVGNVSVEAGDVVSGLTRKIPLRAGGSLDDDDRERTLVGVQRCREAYVGVEGRDANDRGKSVSSAQKISLVASEQLGPDHGELIGAKEADGVEQQGECDHGGPLDQ